MSETAPSNGPDGRGTIASASFWLPGAPEGALIATIGDGLPFAVGRCFQCVVGQWPCIDGGFDEGRVELGINDEFYEDNSGSFKVKFVNFNPSLSSTAVGNMNRVQRFYRITGDSDNEYWSFGFAPYGSATPTVVPGALSASNRLYDGAPASAFTQAFVDGINDDFVVDDPYCICAIDGSERKLNVSDPDRGDYQPSGGSLEPFPQPTSGPPYFTVYTGSSDVFAVDLWVSEAGAPGPEPPLVNPVDDGPPEAPSLPLDVGVDFNPKIVNISPDAVSDGVPDVDPIPTVSEWGMAIMSLLLLLAIGVKFGRPRFGEVSG